MLATEHIIALLQLRRIGRKTARNLIGLLNHNIGCNADLVDFVQEHALKFKLPEYQPFDFDEAFRKTVQILQASERKSINIISYLDNQYPIILRNTPDFPLILNYIGNIDTLTQKKGIAVIGTREPSNYGAKIGHRLGEVLALNGFNIVSGLAIGCDTAGHQGAISANGITTAVLAHGLDSLYPKENRKLADEILDKGGLLLSEYFIGQQALNNFFVERDRIQAGLSLAVVVVETDVKGGTMHTVNFCTEYGRVLACIQHPLEYQNYPKIQGNQLLIKDGRAIPLSTKEDIENFMLRFKDVDPNEIITHKKDIPLTEPTKIPSGLKSKRKGKDSKNQLDIKWE